MDKNEHTFQTVDIDYPKFLHMYAIWTVGDGHIKLLPVYFPYAYKDFEALEKDSKKIIDKANKRPEKTSEALSTILVLPLRFERLIPLYKKYWIGSPLEAEEPFDRLKSFSEATKMYSEFEVLVTPELPDGEEGAPVYTTGNVFKKGLPMNKIEEYIFRSDYHVATEAKHAAIYTIEPPYGYDLITRDVVGDLISN